MGQPQLQFHFKVTIQCRENADSTVSLVTHGLLSLAIGM